MKTSICDVCGATGLSGNPLFQINEFDLADKTAKLLDMHRACIGTRIVNRSNKIYQWIREPEPTPAEEDVHSTEGEEDAGK